MKFQLKSQIQQIAEAWSRLSVVPADLQAWGYPGVTKLGITEFFGGLAEIADQLEKMEDYEPPPISQSVITQNLNAIRQYINQHIPSNPQPNFPAFLQLIENLRITVISWFESTGKKGKQAKANLLQDLAEIVAKIKDAEILYRQIQDNKEKVLAASKIVEAAATEIDTNKVKLSAILKSSDEFITEIRKRSEETTKTALNIKELNMLASSLEQELETDKEKQQELFKKFHDYQAQIDQLIGAASQVGMAASFRLMKTELELSIKLWLLAFVLTIAGLVWIGIEYISPAVASKDWIDLALKLPLTAPLIWLGWFSAKQYGYTVRLRQDYAFKYASAMSFEAHKREAKEIDEELLKKLLDISIQNFAENPLRIYGDVNHASPTNELVDALMKNEGFIEKILKVFKP